MARYLDMALRRELKGIHMRPQAPRLLVPIVPAVVDGAAGEIPFLGGPALLVAFVASGEMAAAAATPSPDEYPYAYRCGCHADSDSDSDADA